MHLGSAWSRLEVLASTGPTEEENFMPIAQFLLPELRLDDVPVPALYGPSADEAG